MPFGYIDSVYIDFPEGQTESRLRNKQNRLGVNLSEFVTRVDGALGALNANTDPLITALTYRSNQDRITGGNTSDKVWQRGAEYGVTRPQRSKGSGWLLPLYENQIALGFTEKALEVMQVDTFERELATTVQAARRGQRADVLEALTAFTPRGLDNDGTGVTPGFIGSGSGDNAYVGPVPAGQTLGSYSHYYRLPTSGVEAAVKAAFLNYASYYPGETFELVGTSDAITAIAAWTEYVPGPQLLVQPGQGTAVAQVDPTQHIGVLFGRIRVRFAEGQLASGTSNFTIYRTAGANSTQNPLIWRYSDIWGADAWVEDRILYPLGQAFINQNYGIGVSDRAAALNVLIAASGSYVPPTILR